MIRILFKGGEDNYNSVKGQKQRHLAANLHTVGKQHLGRRCRWVNNIERSKEEEKTFVLAKNLKTNFIIQDCIESTLLWIFNLFL